jgi:hypothetical protein
MLEFSLTNVDIHKTAHFTCQTVTTLTLGGLHGHYTVTILSLHCCHYTVTTLTLGVHCHYIVTGLSLSLTGLTLTAVTNCSSTNFLLEFGAEPLISPQKFFEPNHNEEMR